VSIKTKQNALFATSATAISAIGLLLAPSPAHAASCQRWALPENAKIRQDNGWTVNFPGVAQAPATDFTGRAFTVAQTGESMSGNAFGGLNGSHLDVTVNWDYGPTGRYVGDVGDDGVLHGTTGGVGFTSEQPFKCMDSPILFGPDNNPSPFCAQHIELCLEAPPQQ
jgi:hypothetical protein